MAGPGAAHTPPAKAGRPGANLTADLIMATPTHKGKGKASEQTPLLDENGRTIGSSLSRNDTHPTAEGPHVSSSTHLSLDRTLIWRSYLCTAVLAVLTLCVGLIIATILLADSYAAPAWHNVSKALSQSGESSDTFWKQALVVHGPDSVRVTGIGRKRDGLGMRLEVNMTIAVRIAVDSDFIMDLRDDRDLDDTWWKKKWRALGQWGVSRLGSTTATMDGVVINPTKLHSSEALLTMKTLSPITIPFRPGLSPEDHRKPPSSLDTVSVSLTIYPSQNVSLLSEFLKQSWAEGHIGIEVRGSNLSIQGGAEQDERPKLWKIRQWRSWLKFDKDAVTLDLTLPIPTIHFPSHPPIKPGSDLPELSDILVLESFNISSTPSDPAFPNPDPPSKMHVTDIDASHVNDNDQRVLAAQNTAGPSTKGSFIFTSQQLGSEWSTLIFARAAVANPFATLASKLDLGHGFPPLPFVISLPIPPEQKHASSATGRVQNDVIPVVEVYALPELNTTHIGIPLSGHVLPFSDAPARLPDAVSAFVASYLSYRPSPISISSPLYPSLEVSAEFPPPRHRLELLRDVHIEDMSIHPVMDTAKPGRAASLEGGIRAVEILASATVHARVVLPRGINIDVRVTRLWVDCFVFDGEVPHESKSIHALYNLSPSAVTPSSDDNDPPLPQPLPLPTPLPVRAFGRITPRAWLNATSSSAPHPVYNDRYHGDASESGGNEAGTNVLVTARLIDVPLEVLPGRQGDLSRFVTKVLFSKDPVVAGIRGVAAVGLSIPGLTIPASSGPRIEGNELILTGLPFEGNVKVGGRGFLTTVSV
ncbi:hypothetical protein JB92DRAFT_2971659 [Gautieria morchelliformis]|nr:hypothetical protein JB92DRAFT_2971659 [Gautieria morchelliformis]